MKMAFLGSKSLGLNVLKAVLSDEECRIIHPRDEADARSCLGDFTDFASSNNIDLLVASSPSAADEMLNDFQPDIVLVCGWYWLIGSSTLKRPPLGVFGIHNSLLPRYRGGSPLVWSILNGDRSVGATVFQITDGMDDGPILEQVEVPLMENESIAVALNKIETRLIHTFPEKWSAYIRGEAKLVSQNESKATYCGQRIPDDGHIDWTKSARAIHNFVRAQSAPYPGAFCFVRGEMTRPCGRIDSGKGFGIPKLI